MSTTSDIADRPAVRPVFRPRVVVRLHDWVDVPYEDDVQRVLVEKFGPGPLGDVVDELRFERLYTAVAPEKLDRLVAEAGARDPGFEPRRLTRWFTVDTPRHLGAAELTKLLLAWDVVETAHPDAPAVDPLVDATNDPRAVNQGYLDPAPTGIDAEFAWTVPGGAGAGQRVVDLEQGWTLDHEDLAGHGASLLFGTLQNGSRPHGTAVLGELCAVDNTLGGVGIAPEIASVDVTSHSGSLANVPDAIVAALDSMQPGDVLLLEVQTVTPAAPVFGAPVELIEESFEAIRLASALGVVVVEAAGNGANDLDDVVDAAGRRVLAPAHPDFRDSGAIVVGAASSTVPHARMGFSSFGARVDCFAWGENVDTTSSTAAGATTLYTTGFSGTSSASPIVAGAALSVQGVAQAAGGGRLSPAQVRAVLSDPATGTASVSPASDLIGVMPNLRAIIEDVLDIGLEDVYLRDNATDTGAPHTGSISTSPDVILRPDVVADPQATYGEGSGTENSMTLGYEATAGQDNHVYVRVRNRGAAPAGPTTVHVYWSEVGTLITPDQWQLVGSTTLPSVPVGDVLTVADAITWAAADVPAPGHYCFVAIAETAQDPAPPLASLVDWDNFRAFIHHNNNVTWRNFNVVPTPGPDDPAVLPFHVAGALDRRVPMLVDVTARLPRGARLWLDAPDFLLKEAGLPVEQGEPVGDGLVRVPLRPQGRQTIAGFVFPARLRLGLRLVVALPEEAREQTGYQVTVRQAALDRTRAGEQESELGRVTWYLAGPEFYERRTAREQAGLA
ncbi:peptidase S8 and S53 subtilisin kexin sedolisin [Cellulomonas flavigena DSM 20109]|uniref:Peptidase S8 and S53 subtilisin kexin sedolisin n=1 Tax=Cellulomonas flavigena (strain ATCC 482 / DSM 20109 / BCRC 11376 / JCM 18109 / NBRC 3775 / NCIMB 8073 / NRS 134) TaxID=446466 RepID=D5UBM1_CELFN|nr:S8 family peptidase [Cellulomonas flavigena]ADG74116.1 peptidase S8 and S53 subtilisin kexin sedolisin [Cellulomonas flavigena DSM 20109]